MSCPISDRFLNWDILPQFFSGAQCLLATRIELRPAALLSPPGSGAEGQTS